MCIRDRSLPLGQQLSGLPLGMQVQARQANDGLLLQLAAQICLLYTSDAADERSSVDLGGRRIIKKKKYVTVYEGCTLRNSKHVADDNK